MTEKQLSNWNAIERVGANLGASKEQMRKWRERGAVAKAWQIKIHNATHGAIAFSDMESPKEG